MTAKEWLDRGWKINTESQSIQREKERTFAAATNAVAGADGEKVQTSQRNTSEMKFINYVSYSEKLENHKRNLIAVKDEIFEAIIKVPDTILRTLLFQRYIEFRTWEEIAEEMDYSREWITKRLHPKALKEFENSSL